MSFTRAAAQVVSIAALSMPLIAVEAVAQELPGRTVSATGSATVRPDPADRRDNASIRRSVEVAREKTVGRAIDDATDRAESIAGAADLALGELLAVGEVNSYLPWQSDFETLGRFGPGQYCGNVRRPVIRRRDGRRRVVRYRTRRVCQVPSTVTTRVEVVFSATAR